MGCTLWRMPAPKDKADSSTNAALGRARLREVRLRPVRDLSLAGSMDRELREIRKLKRAVGAIAQAWNATVPPELLERTALQSLTRGSADGFGAGRRDSVSGGSPPPRGRGAGVDRTVGGSDSERSACDVATDQSALR